MLFGEPVGYIQSAYRLTQIVVEAVWTWTKATFYWTGRITGGHDVTERYETSGAITSANAPYTEANTPPGSSGGVQGEGKEDAPCR